MFAASEGISVSTWPSELTMVPSTRTCSSTVFDRFLTDASKGPAAPFKAVRPLLTLPISDCNEAKLLVAPNTAWIRGSLD